MKLGAQLYTLREYCQTIEDFAETLKRVADIGYTTVQVSGTCPYDPQWLSEQLKANGLRCALTHYNPDAIKTDPAGVVDIHRTFGDTLGGFIVENDKLAVGRLVHVGFDSPVGAVSCRHKGGVGVFTLQTAATAVGNHQGLVFTVKLDRIHSKTSVFYTRSGVISWGSCPSGQLHG
jgi:hypothetical protein